MKNCVGAFVFEKKETSAKISCFVPGCSHVGGYREMKQCREQKRIEKEPDKITGATINPLSWDTLTTLLSRLTLAGYKIRTWFNVK